MISILPIECLEEIIKNLKNDYKSLYSCMLVNCLWSSVSVRYLWKFPFGYFKEPNKLIIQTYLSCLPKDSKLTLLESGIELPLTTSRVPTYNYPSFIRKLCIKSLFITTEILFEKYERTSVLLIVRELCKLFIANSVKIEQLELTFDHSSLINIPTDYPVYDWYLLLPTFPGAKESLSNLKELILDPNFDQRGILFALSEICHKIENLDVFYDGCIHDLALEKLIGKQRNLKVFSTFLYEGDWSIGPPLWQHRNSLKEIIFHRVYFNDCTSLLGLAKCVNLERLIFRESFDLRKELLDEFTRECNLPKLRVFTYEHLFWDMENVTYDTCDISPMLKRTNRNLKRLTFNDSFRSVQSQLWGSSTPYISLQSVEAITLYCQNLVLIDATITNAMTKTFLATLSSCNKLQELVLYLNNDVELEEYLPGIGKNLAKSLRILEISTINDFSIESLNGLLFNCKARLSTFKLLYSKCFNDQYLDVVVRYASGSSLDELKLYSKSKVTNDALKKAKEHIKLVELIEFCSLI